MRLLGTYEIELDGDRLKPPATSKARLLLAYLAMRRGETIRRDALMTEFWPEADQTSARNNLKTTLSTIRRLFREAIAQPDAILSVERDSVRWNAHTWIDAREFQRCSTAVAEERRWALDLYLGEFVPGERNAWADEQREHLASRHEHMLRTELRASPNPALAERLLALDPFSDEAYVALVEHALASGDVRGAQSVFARYAAALAELGEEPPVDLATRVGVRTQPSRDDVFAFCGRGDAFAEFEMILTERHTRVLLLSGIGGIGKRSFAREAQRRFPEARITIFETPNALDEQWTTRALDAPFAIVCAQPEHLRALRAQFPGAAEMSLGALAYDEVAVALRRRFGDADPELIEAIWQRSEGHPLLLKALTEFAGARGEVIGAAAVRRLRLPRELERHFEMQLRAAGDDVWDIAILLGLEQQLDNDDVVALADWSLQRATDARARLARLHFALFSEIALRSLSPGRRAQIVERIAERLRLHEDPSAKLRLGEHLRSLGRDREAARAYYDAAASFAAFAAWENATRAADRGIALLEPMATSAEALDTLRELYGLRGRILYQRGAFVASVRSFESLIEISDEQPADRASALVSMGHALARVGSVGPAWNVARQALEESRSVSLGAELQALHLVARVLRDRAEYDEAVRIARESFERALDAREWSTAMFFGNMIIEVSRRQLRLADCFYWANRQRDAAVLAGPILEAEALFMLASAKFVVNRIDEAIADIRSALPLIEGMRRHNVPSTTPTGQLEWMLHHGLAHAYNCARRPDEAIAEIEWLLRSPWTFNTILPGAQVTSVAVTARLMRGTSADIAATRAMFERIPPPTGHELAMAIDGLARTRIAVRDHAPESARLLHRAFTEHERIALLHPDQVHVAFHMIAEDARGLDDALAERAAAAGNLYESRLIAAAGDLWNAPAQPAHA